MPFPRINFLENPGFEVLYVPDEGVFNGTWCMQLPEGQPPAQRVVHWWGNEGSSDGGFDYYAIREQGTATEQIEFESDSLQGIVTHFRWPESMDDHYLIYRRSATACSTSSYLSHGIYPGQWQPADFELRFKAKGSAGSTLKIRTAVDGNIKVGTLAADWDSILVRTKALTESWNEYTITMPNSSVSVKTVDLRFALDDVDNPPGAEAWLDDIDLNDELKWIASEGEAAAVEIHPEGQLVVDGEPFLLRGAQDSHSWFVEAEPLDTLRSRCQTLGFGPGGMEFNTLLKPPSSFNMYATKREARLILDAAHTADMKVILWLPLFPAIAEPHNNTSLPLVPGLVEDWVENFNDHPALLGWSYGDEKPQGQIGTAVDHHVLENYDAIPAVQARFRPLFLFTGDYPFEDVPSNPGPSGHLEEMFKAAHILMPNHHPIRFSTDDPGDAVPLLSQWCWSKAMHTYGFELLYSAVPAAAIARAVLPVVQIRPINCNQRPPYGHEARTMGAQAATGHGVGFLAHEISLTRLEGDSCDVAPWDLLDPNNRAAWDSLWSGAATGLFEAFPEINRIVEPFAEKRFAGDPSLSALPPAVVTDNAYSPDSTWLWMAEDSWINPTELENTHWMDDELQTGYTCHAASAYCSGFGRIRFLEMQGAFDAARIEAAELLLTIDERPLEVLDSSCSADGNCWGDYGTYSTPMSHVSRIPGVDVAGLDSLFWADDTTGWAKFGKNDVDNVFNHAYVVGPADTLWYQDFGLQFLASGRRDYGQRESIIREPSKSRRIVDFDLTNVVRYWAADTTAAQRRNNGLFIQSYSPTRRFEPHLIYESSDANASPSAFNPSMLVYEVPQGETPKSLGAPFALFYEAPPTAVRIFELAHFEDLGESWLAAINSHNSEQCLRIYSNGHPVDPPPPSLEVIAPRSGQIVLTVPAQTSDAEYINFAPADTTFVWPNLCPDTLEFGIDDIPRPINTPWHPENPQSYQPITRWGLTLPGSTHEWSAVLIRVPHPAL